MFMHKESHMAGRLILVKRHGFFPLLQTSIAIGVTPDGMVQLKSPVETEDGEVSQVPVDRCLEFNGELLERVNTLTQKAIDATNVAYQILENEGKPFTPVFDTPKKELLN